MRLCHRVQGGYIKIIIRYAALKHIFTLRLLRFYRLKPFAAAAYKGIPGRDYKVVAARANVEPKLFHVAANRFVCALLTGYKPFSIYIKRL